MDRAVTSPLFVNGFLLPTIKYVPTCMRANSTPTIYYDRSRRMYDVVFTSTGNDIFHVSQIRMLPPPPPRPTFSPFSPDTVLSADAKLVSHSGDKAVHLYRHCPHPLPVNKHALGVFRCLGHTHRLPLTQHVISCRPRHDVIPRHERTLRGAMPGGGGGFLFQRVKTG